VGHPGILFYLTRVGEAELRVESRLLAGAGAWTEPEKMSVPETGLP
jgi:hypothetical protein